MSTRPQDINPLFPMGSGLGHCPKCGFGDWPMIPAYEAVVTGGTPVRAEQRTALEEAMRWTDRPPPWARNPWFNKALQVTLAGSASRTEIVAFRLQKGFVGMLRFVGMQVANAADAANVTFALLVDGSSVSGYSSILGSTSPGIAVPDPIMLPILPDQRISVVATNASASSIQNVSARIKGWTWGLNFPLNQPV